MNTIYFNLCVACNLCLKLVIIYLNVPEELNLVLVFLFCIEMVHTKSYGKFFVKIGHLLDKFN